MSCWNTDDEDKPVNRGCEPVMLARARRIDGTPVTLRRTYLSKDGYKAPFTDVETRRWLALKSSPALPFA